MRNSNFLGLQSLINWTPSSAEQKRLEKGAYTCASCGIQSRYHPKCPSGFMHFVGKEQALHCTVCAASKNITGAVGAEAEHGYLIYAPDISQGQLSRLSIALFMARYRQSRLQDKADNMWQYLSGTLVSNTQDILRDIGSSFSELGDLADRLQGLDDKGLQQLFGSLRYLPKFECYKNQIVFWDKACVQDFELIH